MKKKIVIYLLAAAMAVSGIGTTSVQGAAATAARQETSTDQTICPTANILDVDFENNDGTDKSELQNTYKILRGNASKDITFDTDNDLNRKAAHFYDYAYAYPFTSEKYDRIANAVTVECMFKYNEFWDGEREVFSNQQGGGIGLGVEEGRLKFYAHVGGSYREPNTSLSVGEWVHAVGVVDGRTVKLYINGSLADSVEAEAGGIKYPESASAQKFVIGADINNEGSGENFSNADICLARIYDHALTDAEIKLLGEKAFEGASITPKKPGINCGIVTSDTAVSGGILHVSPHMNRVRKDEVSRVSCTLSYDPSKMTYLSTANLKNGASITKTSDGNLEITCENFSDDDFRQYASTRLGEISFEITAKAAGETTLEMSQFHIYSSSKEITDQIEIPSGTQTITILAKEELDLNGDGVIGAGDIALAETIEQKTAIAQKAAIYPYKHAVVLTVDGAGNVWNPDELYYTGSDAGIPQKTRDSEIMKKRTNTYAMQLFNEEFATSYTAQSVKPAISAQNYTSILHGAYWEALEDPYKVTNDSAAAEYFADFNKKTAKYPSLFAAAADAAPRRYLAAFSEWAPILNGIIEPDIPVIKKKSKSDEGGVKSESFSDVAEYIRSGRYKNTSVLYMQNDWMDHTGHSRGYYTDTYWEELTAYDDYYKEVMDALKETGTYNETLIIANADHGGSWYNHGSVYSSDTDVFIGLGGVTIDSGARLSGGSNADIPALVLHGLRMAKPNSMTGKVFDESAFLSQEELKKKGREIDHVKFTVTGKEGSLVLSDIKSEIRSADMVLSIGNAKISQINAEDGTILRQKTENGKLYLTIAYKNQPSQLAEITFADTVSDDVKVEEIMLGASDGKEIYPDLTNENTTDISDLQDALEEADRRAQEAERKEAEAKKKAENAEKEAEAARKAAEEAKKEAENLRQQLQKLSGSQAQITLTVNKKSVKLKVGKKYKLKASATASQKITFQSGNKKVASVSKKGVIKGKKKGKTVITVTCGGITKTVKVTVK